MKRGFLSYRILALAMAIGIFVLAGDGSSAPKTLTVTIYGGAWEEFWRNEIVPDFEAECKCKVEMGVGLAKDWFAKLRAGGVNNPPYDVVMTNAVWSSQERAEGFFVDLPASKIPNLKDVHPFLRNPNDNGVIGAVFPVGLGYRTDLTKKPSSWQDLWSPDYKGKIGLYTIGNTGGMMFVLLTSKRLTGKEYDVDAALKEMEKLKPLKLTDFSGDMENLLVRGEVAVGMLDSPAVARLKRQGVKIEWVAPKEGVVMFEQDFNVTKGSKVKDLAYLYIDYILRPKTQQKLVEKFYAVPANTKVSIPDSVKSDIPFSGDGVGVVLKWDWTWVNKNRQDLTEKFNRAFTR